MRTHSLRPESLTDPKQAMVMFVIIGTIFVIFLILFFIQNSEGAKKRRLEIRAERIRGNTKEVIHRKELREAALRQPLPKRDE